MAKLLEDILKQKQEQQKASEFEHVAVRQEWISNCEKLMSKIAGWLQPLEDKNWLEIQSENIPIREDQLGDYEAPISTTHLFRQPDSHLQTSRAFYYRYSRASRCGLGQHPSRNVAA